MYFGGLIPLKMGHVKFWWFETGKSWKILTSDEDFDFDAQKRRTFWDDHPSHGSFDVTCT
jgi:hypothetical protein